MQPITPKIKEFVAFVANHITGDEKGQAQVFLDRLFRAFGHEGAFEAGGQMEYRVHPGKGTKFADLVWPKRVLIEMKKRGEKLQKHYLQARDYWMNLTQDRARYVILCNFDEFWIYDFDYQMNEPVDRVPVADLATRYTALNFLFPEPRDPQFGNDLGAVTRKAAQKVADAFNALIKPDRKKTVPRERAQRLILQCVVALFAEDIELLPRGFFTEVLNDCKKPGGSSYYLLGGLFRQMANKEPAEGGRFQEVRYFNGGIFNVVDPVDLSAMELTLLHEAAQENWSKINPAIFGTLFEGSMDQKERHAFGAHFTSEADIQKVVQPTIIRPWRERIDAAKNDGERMELRKELHEYRVLDPACGSGNFLYIAYRELRRLEWQLTDQLGPVARAKAVQETVVGAQQFFGIDIKDFAVELAKVTLMLAKKLTLDERASYVEEQHLHFETSESPLPMDNLDANIRCDDALFCEWPKANAIIGNPPYLGSRYLAKEHGYDYARKVYEAFPEVPKMADYCVYWFRLAHERLDVGGRAGLVGTKTVRQNESRKASLDYIVANGGTITEAVSHQVWSGEAAVHVSILNWAKGVQAGGKRLYTQVGDKKDSPWKIETLQFIPPTLTSMTDVTGAQRIVINEQSKKCFTGQNPVNAGFFLSPADAKKLIDADPKNRDVIFPYMIGRDLIEHGGPTRWIIDFAQRDSFSAMNYRLPFDWVKKKVMPVVLERAEREKKAKGEEVTRYTRIASRWWQFYDYRPGTIAAINSVSRYIACSRTTKRSIFEFISNAIHSDSKIVVFSLPDDYSFAILQSGIHWRWVVAKGSTLKGDQNYTSDTVFDTFPWPQAPTLGQAKQVAKTAVALRALRRKVMAENNWSLRDLYRTLDLPGNNPVRDAQDALDDAVRTAYGMKAKADPLAFLLDLNQQLAASEKAGTPIVGPGLPPCVKEPADFITTDCVQPPVL
jgi:SAM-dependent methyltransferase